LLRENGALELGKMAVTEAARGKGIGELLAREALKRAKKMGAGKVFLITNSRLAPASEV
jgi:predicted N-acetyltransferase YhbS